MKRGIVKAGDRNPDHAHNQRRLDFDDSDTSQRLRLGSYIVVQVGAGRSGALQNFYWEHEMERLRSSLMLKEVVDVNYMVLGISRFETDEA